MNIEDTYRDIMAFFDEEDRKRGFPYPSMICTECGILHGYRIPSLATYYPGTCGVCGQNKICTEPRDYGHLKPSWEKSYREHHNEKSPRQN